MTSRLERKIDTIMGEAYAQAWVEVRREVYKMMKRNPRRFQRYVHAVGWGPTFFGPDRKPVDSWEMNRREQEFYAYIIDFYDRYGGNNEEISI